MKILIDKIFRSDDISPPARVQESFLVNFKDIKNEEWNQCHKDWEVIFYMEDRECIALFDDVGELKELKTVLGLNQIPDIISGKVKNWGRS